MKKGVFIFLLATSASAQAQSLKDALFGGKLKTQPGSVIRKGDDLSAKMDTSQNAAFNATMSPATTRPAGDSAQTILTPSDSAALLEGNSVAASEDAVESPAATPGTNTAVWKTFMDSVASGVKSDITESKKVKRGDYSVTVTYTIETDGETSINDVFVAPDNDFLKQQVRSRLAADSPRLAPVLNSAGAPRKVIKRQTFIVSKA